MRKNNDFGKMISDKLNDLDQTPKEEIWDKIEVELEKKKQKRLLYFCVLFLLVGFSIGFFLSNWEIIFQENIDKKTNSIISDTLSKPNENITNKENSNNSDTFSKSSTEKISTSQSVLSETESYVIYEEINVYKTNKEKSTISKDSHTNSKKYENSEITTINNNNKSFGSIPKKQNRSYVSNFKNKTTNSNDKLNNIERRNPLKNKEDFNNSNLVTNISSSTTEEHFKNKSNSIKKQEETSTLDSIPLIVAIEKTKVEDKILEKTKKDSIKEESKEQYVSVFFGPTLYSSLSKGSGINSSMKDYKRLIDINTTYGILYRRMFENIGFRIGVTKTNLSYSTLIPNNNNQFITNYSNISLKENITQQSINTTFNGTNEIKLRQHLSYYEIPLEVYKSFINKKSDFGFAIFLGITPQFLDKNNLALESSTIDGFEIGKASNVRDINIGFHVGLGLNYKLTEKLQLDINPILKYQIVPYEDYHNFIPYYLAIQSGLSYKF